ncbi:MAG: heme-binding protein [Actinomycetes bacterium]
MTERQKFEVLQKYKHFESRRYEACVIAQVVMPADYKSATSGAFRYLFNYISKGNTTSTPIAMTAPVIATSDGGLDSQEWSISFVMPAGSSIQHLPTPNNSNVVLRDMPAQDCVALIFRGRATSSLCKEKEADLRRYAQNENFILSKETRICRFDPPFKPGFLHYNEILIPLTNL